MTKSWELQNSFILSWMWPTKKLLFKTMLFQFKLLWRKVCLKHNFFVSISWIYPEKPQIVWRLSYHIIQNEFLGYSEWKGIVPGMSFQVWHFKGGKEITSLHSYLNRSMPGILIGTLTNLLQSVQKYLSVRTLTIQKPVKWFGMQNKLLVSKWFTY